MVERQIFRYKIKKGALHKVPAIIKLLLLIPLSFLCFYLPSIWLFTGIILIICAAFLCGLSLNDQLTDLKPAVLYVIILYCFSVLSNLAGYALLLTQHSPINSQYYLILVPHSGYIRAALRLILVIQLSALVFRTTSLLEIRETVHFDIITIFISFIPEIFKTWANIDLAWRARDGKPGIYKIKTLVFVLISISFEKAAVKSKALEARRAKTNSLA